MFDSSDNDLSLSFQVKEMDTRIQMLQEKLESEKEKHHNEVDFIHVRNAKEIAKFKKEIQILKNQMKELQNQNSNLTSENKQIQKELGNIYSFCSNTFLKPINSAKEVFSLFNEHFKEIEKLKKVSEQIRQEFHEKQDLIQG